VSMLYT